MYLATCCRGAYEGSTEDFSANDKLTKIINGSSLKDGIIEKFITSRCSICFPCNEARGKIFWQLLCFEVMYFWNLLPSCDSSALEGIIDACKNIKSPSNDEPILGLSSFIIATCFNLLKDIKNATFYYRKCIDECSKNISTIKFPHIPAYANYELAVLFLNNYDNDESKIEAKTLLQNAQQFKNYDFECRLKLKLQNIKLY